MTTHGAYTEHQGRTRNPFKGLALLGGMVFLLVGILGFLPGATTNLEGIEAVGHRSEAHLFGLFQISILHNVVHLLFGLAGILMASSTLAARVFLFGGGTGYLVLWIYGLTAEHGGPANFVPLNEAAGWLHFGLGAGMIALGAAGEVLARRSR